MPYGVHLHGRMPKATMTSWTSTVPAALVPRTKALSSLLLNSTYPSELFVNVGEAVGKGKEVGVDHDLEVEVGKEEGAIFDLVAKGLIGIVVAKGVEIGGRVKVRRERGGEVEREVISVGVFGSQVPNDAASGGQEIVLANDDRREAMPEAHQDLLSSLDELECVDDGAYGVCEFANRAGHENVA